MKYLVKFFVVTLLFINCTYASADQKVVYVDVKYILNLSKAGKALKIFLENLLKLIKRNLWI